MSPADGHCEDVRQLLPQLALGIADGEDRATALDHLSACAACRGELAQLSATADDLLALAPQAEPPVGFEARVLERIRIPEPAVPRRPRRRPLRLAAGALAAAAATAISMVLIYSDDHRLATQYRAALQEAHGQYFTSARLRTLDGRIAGSVFAYQGSPSWLFYVAEGPYASGAYREQITTRAGESLSFASFRFVGASWGVTAPIPLRDIAAVRLVRVRDGATLQASLPIVRR